MRHVMDVFEEHDAAYHQLILNEISLHEVKIDKVRAAYILEKRMDFNEATFDNWVEFAQRGGSRKLDASAEYVPKWSERWCLSLNL